MKTDTKIVYLKHPLLDTYLLLKIIPILLWIQFVILGLIYLIFHSDTALLFCIFLFVYCIIKLLVQYLGISINKGKNTIQSYMNINGTIKLNFYEDNKLSSFVINKKDKIRLSLNIFPSYCKGVKYICCTVRLFIDQNGKSECIMDDYNNTKCFEQLYLLLCDREFFTYNITDSEDASCKRLLEAINSDFIQNGKGAPYNINIRMYSSGFIFVYLCMICYFAVFLWMYKEIILSIMST